MYWSLISTDLPGARARIEQARKLPLSVEQAEDLARLEGAVGRGAREQVVQSQVELITAADKAKSLPSIERHAEVERIRSLLVPMSTSPEEARATSNWLDSVDKGEPFVVDPQAEIEADDIIRGLTADSTPQENAQARDKILALQSKLGPRTYDFIKDLGTRLDGEKTKAVEYAVDDAVGRGQIDKAYAPIMRKDLEGWINRQGKVEVNPVDIVARGAVLAAMVPEAGRPLPEQGEKLGRMLSILYTGSERDSLTGSIFSQFDKGPEGRKAAITALTRNGWLEPMRASERAKVNELLDELYPGPEKLPPPPSEKPGTPQVVGVVGRAVKGEPSVKISTKSEWDALKPGTPFEWKDGRKGTK